MFACACTGCVSSGAGWGATTQMWVLLHAEEDFSFPHPHSLPHALHLLAVQVLCQQGFAGGCILWAPLLLVSGLAAEWQLYACNQGVQPLAPSVQETGPHA